jgi:hypothetical protein
MSKIFEYRSNGTVQHPRVRTSFQKGPILSREQIAFLLIRLLYYVL